MTKDIPVEGFVIDAILAQDADIICLIEYLSDAGIESALSPKYWHEESISISGNKVFIAVKKDFAPYGITTVCRNEKPGCYNFLHVNFETRNGNLLSTIGVRMLSPMDAQKQTPPLLDYLKDIQNSYICMGDYNIKDYRMGKWFPEIEKETLIPQNRALSEASIIYVDPKSKVVVDDEFYGAVDHVLHSKDISVIAQYNWDFTDSNPIYVPINEVRPGAIWDVKPGNPDHAMLIAEIAIESDNYVCPKCGKQKPINGFSIPDMCDDCRQGEE